MNKSAHLGFSSWQKGFANLLLIGGVAILGIVVFLIASGSLKLSGYVKVDDKSKSPASQSSQPAAQSSQTPKAAVKLSAEPFVDSKLGFSISYPEGWKVNSTTSNVTIYKPSDTKGTDKADALISVFSVPVGDYKDTKLATIADLHKVQLKKQFSNVNFIKEGEIKVGQENAYEMEFTGVMGTENMHARYLVITSPTKLYAILGGVNEGMWSTYKDDVDASISTFKIQ